MEEKDIFINRDKLRGLMKDNGDSGTFVAKYIGISRQAFARKLEGITPFDESEVKKLSARYGKKIF